MTTDISHTIAAISTPIGEGGIAVIRLSGTKSIFISDQVFKGNKSLLLSDSHRAYHGWIVDGKELIDEVIVTVFKAPNSYTTEDVVEISSHGGIYVSRRILELVIQKGAKPALPGEFTRRAFINGRIDLSQAEAVADIIHAKTEMSRRAALYQLKGNLSQRIISIKEKLIHICSLLELELDFGEDEVEFITKDQLSNLLVSSRQEIQNFIRSFDRGRVYREGLRVVIIGRPNVGKSSVLNALLERERAIVAESPGTTRDTIEETLDLDGLLITVADTAGIRKTNDPIETEGVKRAKKAVDEADFVLLILDASKKLQSDDEFLIRRYIHSDKSVLMVVNKIDLQRKLNTNDLQQKYKIDKWIEISAMKKINLENLILSIRKSVLSDGMPHQDEAILTNVRHRNAFIEADTRLCHAYESLMAGMSQEFIALDLHGAMDSLEEIIGKTTPDEILENIFSQFCIGK